MSATKSVTVPAGTSYRSTSRSGAAIKGRLPESVTIPASKVVLKLSPDALRTVLAFQYKGRRATTLFAKAVRNR